MLRVGCVSWRASFEAFDEMFWREQCSDVGGRQRITSTQLMTLIRQKLCIE